MRSFRVMTATLLESSLGGWDHWMPAGEGWRARGEAGREVTFFRGEGLFNWPRPFNKSHSQSKAPGRGFTGLRMDNLRGGNHTLRN